MAGNGTIGHGREQIFADLLAKPTGAQSCVSLLLQSSLHHNHKPTAFLYAACPTRDKPTA